MIRYVNTLEDIGSENLQGFFVGWPNPPSPEKHLELLQKSDYFWLAVGKGQVVGFITATSDNVLSAYIPFLEVLPSHKGRGIGTELVKLMFESLKHLYMVDLLCDEDVVPFYKRLGMYNSQGMIIRNYDRQSGQ